MTFGELGFILFVLSVYCIISSTCNEIQSINPVIYVSGGYDDENCFSTDTVNIFDLTNKHWCLGDMIPENRTSHGTFYFQNKIYTIGGISTNNCDFGVEMCAWQSSFAYMPPKFETAPPIPIQMVNINSFVIDGKVYSTGFVPNSYDGGIMVFNGTLWYDEIFLSSPRNWFATTSWKDSIWFIGGYGGFVSANILSLVEVWNTSSYIGHAAPSLLTPRASARAATIDNNIYVCGGNSPDGVLSTCETLLLNDDGTIKQNWSYIAEMPRAMELFQMVAYNGSLLIFGGDSDKPLPMQLYDPTTNTWSNFTNEYDPPNLLYSSAVLVADYPIDAMYCNEAVSFVKKPKYPVDILMNTCSYYAPSSTTSDSCSYCASLMVVFICIFVASSLVPFSISSS